MARKSATINVMCQAADKAARSLLRDFGEVEQLQVSKKGPSDFVSKADLKSEKILHAELSKARPDYGFLMEEGGAIEGKDKDHIWVIDPLDGTKNFLHGIPHWAINIALKKNNEVIAGVTYDPCRDEMFWAEKGVGAFMNSKRLRVSGRRSMDESLLATGIPCKGWKGHELMLAQLPPVMAHTAGIRRMGSAALDLAYVAAGRYEGYWENVINEWDIAPGLLLVREAGGLICEVDGGKNMLENGNILATSAALHDDIKNLLKKAAETVHNQDSKKDTG